MILVPCPLPQLSKHARRMIFILLLLILLNPAAICEETNDTQEDPFWSEDMWDHSVCFDCMSADTYTVDGTDETPYVYLYGSDIGTLYLGSHVRSLMLDLSSVARYEVAEDNPYFISIDGILFSKDKKELVLYPCAAAETHYDVPRGTETIGCYAFADARDLTSITLPLGLREIKLSAFSRTGLNRITLPLTVKRVGSYAFVNCVYLTACSAPDGIQWGEYVFLNCPLLDAADYSGDEGGLTALQEPGYEYYAPSGTELPAVANPANVNDRVYLYTSPAGTEKIKGYSYRCGEEIGYLEAWDTEWYRMDMSYYEWNEQDWTSTRIERYGYVRRKEVTAEPSETLFRVASVRPKNDSVQLYTIEDNGTYRKLMTVGQYIRKLKNEYSDSFAGGTMRYHTDRIGWCYLFYNDPDYGMGEYLYFRTTDAVMKREYTGDKRTLGIVLASDPENRVHLRKKADTAAESLDKYFTGTQLEVLSSQGDWYHVRIGYKEGYMMKKYVMIVDQEDK